VLALIRVAGPSERYVHPSNVRYRPTARRAIVMSALPPCVDGSELARTFLNVCSIGRCSHVFGLFTRFT
jgi:hypothetical protein